MKTSELIGPALDWAVAKCEGDDWLFETYSAGSPPGAAYSTDRSLAGSIIDREEISTVLLYGNTWGATTYNVQDIVLDRNEAHYQGIGPTRLIAAMRCFVASKFGDEVELPKELI